MTRPGLLALLVLLTGCAAPTTYLWGHYEGVVYATYAAPGAMPPERQIELLERDYQEARSQDKPVPPGFHAHLGYLYYQIGRTTEARREFETEKAKFPESAVFMDRLLANLAGK